MEQTMTDAEREERAIWKLAQGGYHVRREQGRYLVTSAEQAEELEDLAQLVAFAEAVYERVWTGRTITPSA
jgi:hypothetical protein